MTLNRKRYRLLGIALLSLLALFFAKDEISMAGNESTRFAVVQSLGERGTFAIEESNFRTVDRVVRDGHVYSDKPLPIAWFLGTVYRPIHQLTGWNFVDNYHLLIGLVNVCFSGLINVLLFVWMFNQLCRTRPGSVPAKFLLALAMCVGTWLFTYSVTLNNHTPAALAAFGCYIALDRFRRKPSFRAALTGGIAAGLVAACDLPSGLFFAIAATAAAWFSVSGPPRERGRAVAPLLAGGLAVGAGMLLLNWIAYGTVVPLYLHGDTATFGFFWDPLRFGYLFDCLFWTRGLFSYQPFLLLAIPGAVLLCRQGSAVDRCFLAGAAAIILYYLTGTNEFGGWAYGFRYLVPVIPLLWLAASRWVLRQKSRAVPAIAGLLILVGVVTAGVGTYSPFCVAYEGPRSPEKHFTTALQSTFLGNLLCIAFERNPETPLLQWYIDRYGANVIYPYLYHSFINQKRLNELPKLKAYIDRLQPNAAPVPETPPNASLP